jgi:predicted  nucleic acid-binding Zn-ribbon protein
MTLHNPTARIAELKTALGESERRRHQLEHELTNARNENAYLKGEIARYKPWSGA